MERRLALGLGGILLAAAARADVSEPTPNPYQVIVERNAFGLRPMPTITAGPPTNKLDQLSVKFTGITSDKKSGKKAWLMIAAPPNKNTNPQYLSIPEHEKQGDIEVVEINEKENTVKILLAGAPMELNFKDNGLPTPAAPLVPGIGYTPHGLPAPGIVPIPGAPPILKTAGVSPTGAATAEALAVRAGLQPTTPNTPRVIPQRSVRTTPLEQQGQRMETPIDPRVQRLLMEAQKVQAEKQGIPFPPLPPLGGQPQQ